LLKDRKTNLGPTYPVKFELFTSPTLIRNFIGREREKRHEIGRQIGSVLLIKIILQPFDKYIIFQLANRCSFYILNTGKYWEIVVFAYGFLHYGFGKRTFVVQKRSQLRLNKARTITHKIMS
jgi:hypothetical protein